MEWLDILDDFMAALAEVRDRAKFEMALAGAKLR